MPSELAANDESNVQPVISEADEKLLKQIRDDYRYFLDYWREIREEYATDMQFVSGDPWTPEARAEREDAHRPIISPDEISQYVNQAINNLRQNKRAIKVNPKGEGSKQEAADARSAIIRSIEYQSNAQAAYTTAFEGAINGGFGAFRLTTAYSSENGPEQEPRIKRIPNPMTVLPDPDAKEADFSDMEKCFVTDTIRRSDFARKYPKAQKKSFSAEDGITASGWLKGENLVIAEYWTVEKSKRKKLWLDGENEPVFEDARPKDDARKVLNGRVVEQRKVVQYITNGVEILERNEWIGSWIPIVLVTGKEIYLTTGGRTKRVLMSLIRLARHPQQMLAFIASQEAEEFGMAPRAPFVGIKGQFESAKDTWETLNKIPRPYVEYDAVVDSGTGQILPPPSRPQFQPNAQAYEIARESWRRAIQAAMGISSLPTAAQRRNEKSGKALQQIQMQEQIGSFHFTDNFDRALENGGRQLNELVTRTYDTPRTVGARNPDDTHTLMRVTTSKHMNESPMLDGQDTNAEPPLVIDQGEFDVTISTGPSFQSQREEASATVDLLVGNIQQMPPPGTPAAKIMAKAIRLKNLGPIGDEISEILDPSDEQMPPQAQAAIQQIQQQAQQHTQALNLYAQKLEKEIQELKQKEAAHVIDNEYRSMWEKWKLEAQVTVAEITTKSQESIRRMQFEGNMAAKLHVAAHERGMAAESMAHDSAMAEADQAHQSNEAEMARQAAAQQAAQQQEQPQV